MGRTVFWQPRRLQERSRFDESPAAASSAARHVAESADAAAGADPRQLPRQVRLPTHERRPPVRTCSSSCSTSWAGPPCARSTPPQSIGSKLQGRHCGDGGFRHCARPRHLPPEPHRLLGQAPAVTAITVVMPAAQHGSRRTRSRPPPPEITRRSRGDPHPPAPREERVRHRPDPASQAR